MSNEIPEDIATFPISVVTDLTDLSARQIRYYEEQGLVAPARTNSNRRVYSLKEIDRLNEIRALINQGINIAGIKAMLNK